MQKITQHLWFDNQAKEAGAFYTSVFGGTINSSNTIHDTPSGDVDMLSIELAGQTFMLISAGPLFEFNPSISFLVACATKDEVDALWQKLSGGGETLMPLDAYPFSERYGWTKDRYGLSWQVMYAGGREIAQKITPVLMFTQSVAGKAGEAIDFYTSVFRDSAVGDIARYGKGQEPDAEGTVMFGRFALEGQNFAAMDSAHPHAFTFNEAISLMVHCDSQEEIDYYWDRLSADPKAEQCGWLEDRYGVSWQIVPTEMEKMLATSDPKRLARVTQAFLKMKKFDLAKLRDAYNGDTFASDAARDLDR